ncbi:PqqD family peptide modification chaperone [Verrucomicrobiota bacterium]
MTGQDIPVARPEVVLREESDDWAMLFDPDTGDLFGLNPVGVLVWRHMDGSRSIGDIARALSASVDGLPANAEEQIALFIQEIVGHGLARYGECRR